MTAGRFLLDEFEKWAKVIKFAGIKPIEQREASQACIAAQ